VSFLAIGSKTAASDIPTSGSASYSGIVDGLWHDGETVRRLYGSEARLQVNFATGQLASTLDLVGRGNPFGDFMNSPSAALGTFAGTGTIANGFFSGQYIPTNGYSGEFGGTFFGPAAAEFGLTFGLRNNKGGSAAGSAVGKRD
jgi:hypothetical protein